MINSKYKRRVLEAKVGLWLAQRASRETGLVDRACRFLLTKILSVPAEKDFMKDDIIENDVGYSAEELDRYQRGEL